MIEPTDDMTLSEYRAWNNSRWRAGGPLVKPGHGYQEIIALPSGSSQQGQAAFCADAKERSRRLMRERELEMESGDTPAMAEALANLERRIYGD